MHMPLNGLNKWFTSLVRRLTAAKMGLCDPNAIPMQNLLPRAFSKLSSKVSEAPVTIQSNPH